MTTDQDATTTTLPPIQYKPEDNNRGQARAASSKGHKVSKQRSIDSKSKTIISGSYKGPNPTKLEVEGRGGSRKNKSRSDNADSNSTDSSDSETGDNAKSNFFRRVYGLPLVKGTVEKLRSYVDDDKAPYSKYAKFAVEKAGGMYYSVSQMTQPYQDKMSTPLNIADNFGCKSLDFIESKFPVVKQDPKHVYTQSRSALGSYRETINKNLSSAIKTPSIIMQKADSNISSIIDNILHYVDEKHEKSDASADRREGKEGEVYNSVSKINILLSRLMHNSGDLVVSILSRAKSTLVSVSSSTRVYLSSVNERVQSAKTRLYSSARLVREAAKDIVSDALEKFKDFLRNISNNDNVKKLTERFGKLDIVEKFWHLKDQLVKLFSDFTTAALAKKQNSS